jgi:hypothetical protein
MKSRGAIVLALVLGFILGNFLHAGPVRADSPTTIYLDEIVGSGTKQAHTISGTQVVGFSCGPAMTGMGMDCYALSTK